jgi:response regulator RpfG family c-di-GMP phosphodiesterase
MALTEKQVAARRQNAQKARAARSERAAERQAAAGEAVKDAYRQVLDEIDAALAAGAQLRHRIATSHIQRALLLLGRVAAGSGYDAARSRSIMMALRETQSRVLVEHLPWPTMVTR